MKRLRAVPTIAALGAIVVCSSMARVQSPKHWCGAPLRADAKNVSVVTGILGQVTVWGPPNYGETPKEDKRNTIWVLTLDYALPVDADVDLRLPARRVMIAKLQLMDSPTTYYEFRHRHIMVTGVLRTQVFPGDYTPITMEPKGLQLVGEVACDGSLLVKG